MKILLTLLIFVKTQILACALCALMTPTAHIFLDFNLKDDMLENIEISWIFSQNFTDLTLEGYDFNANSKLEKNELDEVSFAMLNYIADKNFLMRFEWYDMPDGASNLIEGNFSGAKTVMENGRIIFKFTQNIGVKFAKNRVFKTTAYDENGYFNFTFLNSDAVKINENMHIEFNSNLGANFALFESGKAPVKFQKSLKELVNESGIDNSQKLNFIEKTAINSLEKLKAVFSKSEFSLKILISVIFISFLYGFFHAAGPGHAKVLTTSYFLANGGSYLKSFKFALKIGFFHVAGAFLIVLITVFFIDLIAGSISSNAIKITTQISALMIICIAIYMFIQKVKAIASGNYLAHSKECGCVSCKSLNELKSKIFNSNLNGVNLSNLKSVNFKFSPAKPKKKKSKEEWIIALSSAIIPCPGTILVFLLAFNLGSYFLACLSALFMGLGMSAVIFFAAVFGASINKFTSAKFENLKIYIEFLGLAFMLIIGVFMFLIAGNLGAF